MKKTIIIFAFLFVLSFTYVTAWLDCTSSSCPSGYTDNGQYCTGGTCYRNCTIPVCTTDWVEVHSQTCGWAQSNSDEEACSTNSYTPTNNSQCYKFTYDGPPADSVHISMSVTDSEPCDSEAIGGFWEGSSASPSSNPWFNNMNNYLGSNPGTAEHNYLLKIMRAHADDDANQAYRDSVSAYGEIFCANNSVACSEFGGTSVCDSDCYGVSTLTNTQQGYYEISGSQDQTLYQDQECGNAFVGFNEIDSTTYKVYAAPTVLSNGDTSCNRTNEAPIVTNVMVLPLNATAGQDIECNYTYNDTEGYAEQASAFEWWKNGANQNINSSYVDKSNLTIGDSWYCKVAPGDGLMLGTLTQSSNNLTILTTVQNVQMFVAGNSVWQYSNYFWGKNLVLNFTDRLNTELESCVPDAEGYCTINLTFYSGDEGKLNISKLGIYYETIPKAPVVNLNSPANNSVVNSPVTFNCSAVDYVGLSNITLYGNWSGGWHANQTQSLTGASNSTTFTVSGLSGINLWNCRAYDVAGRSAFATANRTITISTAFPQYSNILETPTDPTINYSFNAKYNFNITWTDDISVSTVTLEFDGTNYTSLSQNGNAYGKEFTNLALGTHTYRWYATDSFSNQNSTSSLTYTVNEAVHAFDFVNSTGGVVAWFGHLGHLVLKGTVQQSSSYQIVSDDLFVIRNSGQDVFIVAKNGTVYIDGTLNQNQPTLSSSDSSNDFRIRNSSSLVSYVNNTGHLFLAQSIIENGIN